jgi:hypothetical protein
MIGFTDPIGQDWLAVEGHITHLEALLPYLPGSLMLFYA